MISAVAAAIAVTAGSFAQAAPEAAPGLLALDTDGRIAVKGRFKRFLQLANAGDPSLADYRAAEVDIQAPDAPDLVPLIRNPAASGVELVPYDILLDDGGSMLSAEIEFRPTAGAAPEETPRRRTVFYTLKDGRVVSARIAMDGATLIPGKGTPLPRSQAGLEPLPATAAQPFMTRQKFEDYLRLFGKFDERYLLYYHPEVVFGIRPAAQPLYGRDEILALYQPLRKVLDESVVVNAIVIDSERGAIAAEITNTMTATGAVNIAGLAMRPGDRRRASGVVFYELKDGMIIELR